MKTKIGTYHDGEAGQRQAASYYGLFLFVFTPRSFSRRHGRFAVAMLLFVGEELGSELAS